MLHLEKQCALRCLPFAYPVVEKRCGFLVCFLIIQGKLAETQASLPPAVKCGILCLYFGSLVAAVIILLTPDRMLVL